MKRTAHVALVSFLAASGCGGGEPVSSAGVGHSTGGHHAGGDTSGGSSREAELDWVAAIHGEAGPYAVAGYRIGQRALRELALGRGAHALAVRHESPDQVRWSCVVDGLQASTGASLGRMNLERVSVADPSQTRTVVVHRQEGRALVFRLTESFERRFVNATPRNARALGAQVLELSDDEIFELVDADGEDVRGGAASADASDDRRGAGQGGPARGPDTSHEELTR
jgi:formylmethanofuran dehydrogenase subunit E